MEEKLESNDPRTLKEKIIQSIRDTETKKESLSEQVDNNKTVFLAALAAAFMLSFTVFATYNSFLSSKLTKRQIPPKLQGAQTSLNGCVISGCNSEICAKEEMISACLHSEKFACYKTATCETQEDGMCGWTLDEKLESCLEKFVPQPSI